MARTNRHFHGKRVSRSHYVLLLEAESRGVIHAINQGRRTLAEQWHFWRIFKRFGHPVAAFPSLSAPHIKWFKENHAIDADAPEPVHALARFYEHEGVPVAFNVLTEAWHMDTLDEKKLKRAAARFMWRDHPTLHPGAKGRAVLRLKRMMRAHKLQNFNPGPIYGKGSVAAIKRLQKRHGLKADGIVGPATWKALR